MNGVHDMGGMHGMGPIQYEKNEPVFHAPGEGRVLAMARAVSDPRGVLREFGLELMKDVEVRVWDSTAELRYLVLPERPAGGENLSEKALAALVTRDAMIGVAKITLSEDRGTHQ